MNEEQPIFKVTDRRLFNPDGTPRDVERSKEAPAKEVTTGEAQGEASSKQAERQPSSTEQSQAPSGVDEPQRETAASAQTFPSAPEKRSDSSAAVSTATSAAARPTAVDSAEQSPEEDYADSDIPGADDPTSFLNFLMSIASNAAAALGMMEHPVTGQRSVEPELAKHWIDVLGMLQHKTRGNLAPQEQQIFEGMLADLRMQYVSLTGASQSKSVRGFSGSDITGGR